jgi:hypothetical protein
MSAVAAPRTRTKPQRIARALSRTPHGALVELQERRPRSFTLAHDYVTLLPCDFGVAFR